jgi:hypothetical protein
MCYTVENCETESEGPQHGPSGTSSSSKQDE